MRRMTPAALAFFFLCPVAHAQQWTVEQREVIEQLKTCWDIWEDALQAGDPAPWLERCADPGFTYWADEAVPAGVEMTRRAWGTWMESDYQWLDLRPLVVTIHDDIAIMQFYGYWNEKRPDGRAIIEGKRMEVFRKVDGRWLLLAGHATAPPETPVSAPVEAEPTHPAGQEPRPTPPPTEGTLRLTISPGSAQVQIDNQAVQGRTHSLPPGEHRVTASAAGYESFNRDIRIVVGETSRLSITLEEEPPASQCETFNTTDYNVDGSCFDAQPRPKVPTIVPLTDNIPGRPSPATLAIKVNIDGTVALVLSITNSDNAAFTQAALLFAQTIEYNPAQKNGQAVVGWTLQVFYPGRRQ